VAAPTTVTIEAATTTATVVPEGYEAVMLRVVSPDGRVRELCVLLASTAAQRARGLMGVTSLGGYDGMLFDFGGTVSGRFWMRDTLIPLSIAFFDGRGELVSTADMTPCPAGTSDADCPRYGAKAPYATALEAQLGQLGELGIVPGVTVTVEETKACSATG